MARHVGNFKTPLPGRKRGWKYGTRELQSPACESHVRARPLQAIGKLRPRGAGNRREARGGGSFVPWSRPRAPRGLAVGRGVGSRSPDLTRGPHTRSAPAYLAALLLHFPRRAHKACLQQMLVDQGKQLPPLPGLGHARDLPPVGSPARPPQSPPATSLVP